ncbi:MAG: hypothetical protein ACE5DN_00445, partial [Flavobacteriales bacterium]
FTTLVWLTVTFLTPPSDEGTLSSFYSKVHPGGWWKPFRTAAPGSQGLALLWFCWLTSIVFTYALLFLTGKALFKMWNQAGIWLAVAALSLLLLLLGIKRLDLGGDQSEK